MSTRGGTDDGDGRDEGGGHNGGGHAYVCEHVTVEAQVDHYEDGLVGQPRLVGDRSCYLRGNSLQDLLNAIGSYFCIDTQGTVAIKDCGSHFCVTITATEDDEGMTPSTADFVRWKKGEIYLYCVEYRLHCYKALLVPLSKEEYASVEQF